MPGAYSQESLEAHFAAISKRLGAIEEQLTVLSNHAGVPYVNPSAGIPEDVKALAREGKEFEALRRYRELTNASLEEAREAVASISR
jgi:ribosomal protein L7/L12